MERNSFPRPCSRLACTHVAVTYQIMGTRIFRQRVCTTVPGIQLELHHGDLNHHGGSPTTDVAVTYVHSSGYKRAEGNRGEGNTGRGRAERRRQVYGAAGTRDVSGHEGFGSPDSRPGEFRRCSL